MPSSPSADGHEFMMQAAPRTGAGPGSRETGGSVPARRTARRGNPRPGTPAPGASRRRPPLGRNASALRLVSAGMLAGSLQLAGCGGGDSGTGISGVTPPPGTATYHDVPGTLPPGAYTFSGSRRDAVHIGIEDSPVYFTDPDLFGRVQLEGAAFAYWRPLASQPTQHDLRVVRGRRSVPHLPGRFRWRPRPAPGPRAHRARARRVAGRERHVVPPRPLGRRQGLVRAARRRRTSRTAPWWPWSRRAGGFTRSPRPVP